MPSLIQLQSHVLAPNELVDYSTIVMSAYNPQVIRQEPFIGFKLLCHDDNAMMAPDPRARLAQIDQQMRMFINSGCILREALDIPNGLYLITMPVPRNQIGDQLNRLNRVITMLSQYLGINQSGLVEINVSGYCPYVQMEERMKRLMLPEVYLSMLCVPPYTPYKYGSVYRINEDFICFRTKWNLNNATNGIATNGIFEYLLLLSQLLCSMY